MGQGFSRMKKQAAKLQEQMAQMQEDMQKLEVEGSAGNGLVTITLSGEGAVKKVLIKPECVDPEDVEGLQDLIMAAFDDAKKKVDSNSPAGDLLGGLSLDSFMR